MKRSGVIATAAICGLLVAACSPGTTAARPAGGPESVRIGPYTQVFASALPADPARARVMQAFREGEVLWTRSEVAFRLVAPVQDYVTGQAFSRLAAAVHAGRATDVVPAGTDRLFMTRVALITGSRAVITTCDDGSRFREQNPRTGRVDLSLTTPPQQEYVSETWRMDLLRGHWAITGMSLMAVPSRSAERCQPGLAASGAPHPPAIPVLVRTVVATIQGARSVHASGMFTQGGKTLSVDLGMTRSGGSSGQFAQDGTGVTLLATGGRDYVRLSAAFLRLAHLPSAACKRFCGKYLETTPAQFPGLAGVNMAGFIGSLTRSLVTTPVREVSFGGTIAFDRAPVWVLQFGQQDTAFVAARGQPYLQALTQPGAGMLSFTQWNSVRIPGPPPASQVVNLSQLSSGLAA